MHPSVVSERSGECPICGMALVQAGPARETQPPQADADRRSAGEPGGPVPGQPPVEIALERTQLIGMRTAKATRQRLAATLRTAGFVAAEDSAISIATTRYSGWIEEVRVAPGQFVEKNQVLATVSGPELLTAQQVYLAQREWGAKQAAPRPGVPASSQDESNALKRIGIAPQDIEAVERKKRPLPVMPIRAPASGYVASRNVLKGLYVQPGTELFQIVDLTKVAVVGEVYESDAGRLRPGQRAQLSVAAFPGETFSGTLDLVYPAVDPVTRGLRVRMQLPNPELKLRPGMTGDLLLEVEAAECIAVPAEAVVDTGELQYVFLARPNGRFEPRVVRAGRRAEGRVQILDGLGEGELVVSTANFFVDAESRLRGVLEASGRSSP